jgi:hypothetical protein
MVVSTGRAYAKRRKRRRWLRVGTGVRGEIGGLTSCKTCATSDCAGYGARPAHGPAFVVQCGSPAALFRLPVSSIAECRGGVTHFDFFFAALFFVDFLADPFVADFLVADFFAALFDVRFVADFFAADFFADFLAVFFAGTFPPARRASDSPMAIACLRLVTFLPDLPLRKVPVLRSCIAFLTFDCALFPYFGMLFSCRWPAGRDPGRRLFRVRA